MVLLSKISYFLLISLIMKDCLVVPKYCTLLRICSIKLMSGSLDRFLNICFYCFYYFENPLSFLLDGNIGYSV